LGKKKSISILGSTGSVGVNSLDVIKNINANIVALSANENISLLEQQINIFKPKIVAIYNEEKAEELKKRITSVKIVSGVQGLVEIATIDEVNFVISAISGAMGLIPTIAAINAGKNIGLANKETLVCAGEYILKLLHKNNVYILPIDSEHNAIFQCLRKEKKEDVKRLVLTASGGPFFKKSSFNNVTLEEALNHPTYKMGKKISVDSSTLMNKGLEIIEAHFLFDMPLERIDAVIHPQSFIHSFIELVDGSLLAQMSNPDMRIPIQYALTYPRRKKGFNSFDFTKYAQLEFFPIDEKKFKCFQLAKYALKMKKSYPCYLNAANEVVVESFLRKEIPWIAIGDILEKLIASHSPKDMVNLEDILAVDNIARKDAKHKILNYRGE